MASSPLKELHVLAYNHLGQFHQLNHSQRKLKRLNESLCRNLSSFM